MVSTTMAVPQPMQTFFHAAYGENSTIVQSEDKFPVYSVPGQGILMTTDPYEGCHVIVLNTVKHDRPLVKAALKQLVKELTEEGLIKEPIYKSVTVDILLPAKANMTSILPGCFKIGNQEAGGSNLIKDDQRSMLSFWKWTYKPNECTIPLAGATHNYGASAALIDLTDQLTGKVFLILPKHRPNWEFPGGAHDLEDQELRDTPFREAQEEGGFENMDPACKMRATIVTLMELPCNAFARGIHQVFACFVNGMSEQAFFPQPSEIQDAGWFDLDIVRKAEEIRGFVLGAEVKPSIEAALSGRGLQRTFESPKKIIYTSIV